MKHLNYKEYFTNVIPCLGYGIFCGAVTGGVIFFLKIGAAQIEVLSRQLYALADRSPFCIPLIFALLALVAVLMWLLHRKLPEVKGGGIPRSEGILRGLLSFRWLRTLIGTVIGSFLSFFAGLPLGSEGPAVLIGTSIGGMFSQFAKHRSAWNRYIMTGGAGAGFAVATGAPLSAMLFALEEIHKRFTPMLVLIISTSVAAASYVNGLLCSLFSLDTALFSAAPIAQFELSHAGYLLLLGIIAAFAVGMFDASIGFYTTLTARLGSRFPAIVKLLIIFGITGVLGICLSEGVYSGHHVVTEVLTGHMTAGILFALLIVRMLLMLLVTDSGATGGIFIPTLAIGALLSGLTAKLLIALGMPQELFSAVVLLGMCAFIGGTLRAPLTASVLFIELSGQFTDLFYVVLVVFTVNFITEIFHQKPFYDRVLERMEETQNHGKQVKIGFFEMKVSSGAFVIGKAVRDIMWPSSSVVISVTRAEGSFQDMDNDGEKKLYAGDTLVLRAKFFEEDEVKKHLYDLVGREQEIRLIDDPKN